MNYIVNENIVAKAFSGEVGGVAGLGAKRAGLRRKRSLDGATLSSAVIARSARTMEYGSAMQILRI